MEVKKGKNYIDNKLLFEAFVEWYAQRKKAEEEGKPEPEPPALIVEAILLIPTKLATSGNFSGYSFKEEMIGDAIENILQYYRNFDPTISQNPFAYLSQIAYYAFLRRIKKEKKQSYIKHKLIKNSGLLDNFSAQEHDQDTEYTVSFLETLQMSLNPDLEAAFEKKKESKPVAESRKGRKPKKLGIEELL